MIAVDVHLFNSLAAYAPGASVRLSFPDGTRAHAILQALRIPADRVYAAWRNGHDIMTTFGGRLLDYATLEHGDRIALSGPVPFSRGYGAPVC